MRSRQRIRYQGRQIWKRVLHSKRVNTSINSRRSEFTHSQYNPGFHQEGREGPLFQNVSALFWFCSAFLKEISGKREQSALEAPFSFNATMVFAQSEHGGKAPIPSLEPGSRPSSSIESEILLCGVFFLLGPLRTLRPIYCCTWDATEGDRPLTATSSGWTDTSGLSSSSSSILTSSFSMSIFQSVSYWITVDAAFAMWSSAQTSIRSASVWYIEPGGL